MCVKGEQRQLTGGGGVVSGSPLRGLLCFASVFVCALMCSWCVAAQHASEGARSRRQAAGEDARARAQRAQDLGYHDEAARWFEAAYRYQARSEDLLSAVVAYDQARQPATAATLCLDLVDEDGEEQGEVARTVRDLLSKLRQRLVFIRVACRSCRVEVDGEARFRTRFFVEPQSKHVLVVEQPGAQMRREFSGKPGQTLAFSLRSGAQASKGALSEGTEDEPERAASDPSGVVEEAQPTGVASSSSGQGGSGVRWRGGRSAGFDRPQLTGLPPIVAYIGLGASVALLGASVAFTLHARSGVDEYEEAAARARDCSEASACDVALSQAEKLLAAGRRKELLATVSWVGAGTFSVLAVALAVFLTDWSADSPPKTAVLLRPGIGGGRLEFNF